MVIFSPLSPLTVRANRDDFILPHVIPRAAASGSLHASAGGWEWEAALDSSKESTVGTGMRMNHGLQLCQTLQYVSHLLN